MERRYETPYQRAARLGRESGQRGEDWRANPYMPGTRAYYEFEESQEEVRRENNGGKSPEIV